jgi:hypothetical protein
LAQPINWTVTLRRDRELRPQRTDIVVQMLILEVTRSRQIIKPGMRGERSLDHRLSDLSENWVDELQLIPFIIIEIKYKLKLLKEWQNNSQH